MANTIEIIGSWPSGETEYVIGTENPSKLPLVSDSDNGDVLTVVNGAWKDAAPTGCGCGGGLPPVTSDDNGDFLGVVGGEWGKVGGYSVTETTIIAEQTLTPEDDEYVYFAETTAVVPEIGDSVEVTFNGTTYNLTVTDDQGAQQIGEGTEDEPSFDNYPFLIIFYYDGEDNEIGMAAVYTETGDDFTIKVESKAVTVSDDFKAAVAASESGGGTSGGIFWVTLTFQNDSSFLADKSYNDVVGALENGQIPCFVLSYNGMWVVFHFISARYDNGKYQVTIHPDDALDVSNTVTSQENNATDALSFGGK